MKKQVFSVIMALCLCLGLLPTAALAEGESTAVAKIGEQAYEDLQTAINFANGETVTLLNDVTLTKTLTVNKTITLDLNGHTLTGAAGTAGTDGNNGGSGGSVITVENGGNLTVSGSGTISGGNGGSGGSAITVKNGGSLTVSGGEIKGGTGGSGGTAITVKVAAI